MDGKSWRENGLRLRRKPTREVEASSRRVLFCAPEPARRPLSADNRARLHRIALAIEANGRPLDRRRPEDGLHRRPARLPSQAHELIGRRRRCARGPFGTRREWARQLHQVPVHVPCADRAKTAERPQGFKPCYAVV